MRVEPAPFSPQARDMLVHDIAAFWQYHASLVSRDEAALLAQAEHTLSEWPGDGYALFSILFCGKQAGFLHMQRTGPIVMQLEDIFVQPALRGQGIATAAIEQAEEICRRTPGIEAVTLQAVTWNEAALRLYHKLGYDTLPLVTLRKKIQAKSAPPQAAVPRPFVPILTKIQAKIFSTCKSGRPACIEPGAHLFCRGRCSAAGSEVYLFKFF